MPYIDITTNAEATAECCDKIKARCGKAISLIPAKSESYLMVNIKDGASLYFQGKADKAAMCSVSIFGKADKQSCQALTSELTEILSSELGVSPSRIYVKFQFNDVWGMNGYLF